MWHVKKLQCRSPCFGAILVYSYMIISLVTLYQLGKVCKNNNNNNKIYYVSLNLHKWISYQQEAQLVEVGKK